MRTFSGRAVASRAASGSSFASLKRGVSSSNEIGRRLSQRFTIPRLRIVSDLTPFRELQARRLVASRLDDSNPSTGVGTIHPWP